MKRFCAVVLLSGALAGCGGGGGGHTSSTASTPVLTPAPNGGVVTIPGPVEARPAPAQRPVAAQLAQRCPVGSSRMGCAEQAIPNLTRGPGLAIPRVALFPDVSEYQRAVDWASVAAWQRRHGWHPLAIWKLGEVRLDHYARRNGSETARLGFYRAGYWFVRATGCDREAGQMIAEGRVERLRVLVEDVEVPEAAGYAACLTLRLHRAGFTVIEYSGPGTNPDAINPGVPSLWVAAYGPSHPPCLFVCTVGDLRRQSIVAWQLTDGQFGFVTFIPGIGADDVSADYGISRVLAGAATGSAKPAASSLAIYPAAVYRFQDGIRVSERATVADWDRRHCTNPVRRDLCIFDRRALSLLRDREWFVAHHTRDLRRTVARPRWRFAHLGARFQGLSRRINGHGRERQVVK